MGVGGPRDDISASHLDTGLGASSTLLELLALGRPLGPFLQPLPCPPGTRGSSHSGLGDTWWKHRVSADSLWGPLGLLFSARGGQFFLSFDSFPGGLASALGTSRHLLQILSTGRCGAEACLPAPGDCTSQLCPSQSKAWTPPGL